MRPLRLDEAFTAVLEDEPPMPDLVGAAMAGGRRRRGRRHRFVAVLGAAAAAAAVLLVIGQGLPLGSTAPTQPAVSPSPVGVETLRARMATLLDTEVDRLLPAAGPAEFEVFGTVRGPVTTLTGYGWAAQDDRRTALVVEVAHVGEQELASLACEQQAADVTCSVEKDTTIATWTEGDAASPAARRALVARPDGYVVLASNTANGTVAPLLTDDQLLQRALARSTMEGLEGEALAVRE